MGAIVYWGKEMDLHSLKKVVELAQDHNKPLVAIAGSRALLEKLAQQAIESIGTGVTAVNPQLKSVYGVQLCEIKHPERFGMSHDDLIQVTSLAELYAINRLDFMNQAQLDVFQMRSLRQLKKRIAIINLAEE